jgi:hypothetical protein
VAIACGASNIAGALFNRSLYERAVRGKQMPILLEHVPHSNRFHRADQIMHPDVVTLKVVDSVKNIHECLKSEHNGFPIINS